MSRKPTPGSEPIYDTRTLGLPKILVLSLWHLFAMFGATVLTPILIQGYGLPLSTQATLFFTGIDTLFLHICTRLKVPAFLGSSFAYLGGLSAAAVLGSDAYATMEPLAKLQYAYGGIVVAGLLYVILAVIIRLVSVKKVMRFPLPVVTGPIIILTDLSLAPSTISNTSSCWWLALLSVAIIIAANTWRKGMVKIISILLGAMIPYLMAMAANVLGTTAMDASGSVIFLMDFSAVATAAPIGLRPFFTDFTGSIARFDMTSILVMAPIAVATMMEHIGDMSAISATAGRNFLERPGLHHTPIGDDIVTSPAGLFGGPAGTIYGGNTNALALSRIYDLKVVRLVTMYAVVLSFSPIFAALVNSIPTAIIGGVPFVLYGMIPAVDMHNMVGNRANFANSRSLIIAAVILVYGLGFSSGITSPVGGTHVILTNLAIAAIAGIALNAILPSKDYESGSDVTESRSGNSGRY